MRKVSFSLVHMIRFVLLVLFVKGSLQDSTFFSVCFKEVRNKYQEGQDEEQCIDELKNCFQNMTSSLIG